MDPTLQELLKVAAVALATAVVLGRLRIPTIAGFLVAGAVAGPNGLGLVRHAEGIEALAEGGVVLLLFTIGLELPSNRLLKIGRLVVLGGALQVVLTTGVTMLVAVAVGYSTGPALVLGFVVSLSSTAIVLRSLAEKRELDAPHGRLIVGVMVFQDLCVVPMALLVPILGRGGGDFLPSLAVALAQAAALIAAVFALSRLVLPHFLRWVAATRSAEVFLLAVLAICVGIASLANLAGLSLALGAFLAGLVLAGTQYGGRALTDILPFRNLLTTVFFVSVGMLFDWRWIAEKPVAVGLLLLAFLVGKGLFATLAALVMRFPPRVAWLAGVGLAQFGEFGYVLMRLGETHGLLAPDDAGPLLSAGLLSMVLTPLAMRVAPHFAAGERVLWPLARLLGAPSTEDFAPDEAGLSDHVVVVGYGVAGRLLTRALREAGVRYLVLELNAETVRRARRDGEAIYYGDVTSPEALRHAGLDRARALVLLVNDPDAAARAVRAAREFAPRVPVLIRSRYLVDRPPLHALGAADVVLEEVEGGTEMIARLLRRLGTPGNVIADRVRSARRAVEHEVREGGLPPRRLGETSDLDALRIETFLVGEDAHVAGKTLARLKLRTNTGALAVAKRAGGVLVENPDPEEVIRPGDTLFLIGTPQQIARGLALLERERDAAKDGA